MLTKSGLEDWSGKLHTAEFSDGWVLKIRRRHLHRTVQRLRNISEWIALKAGVYREATVLEVTRTAAMSVLARIFLTSRYTFCRALLPYLPFNLFVFKANPQSLPSPRKVLAITFLEKAPSFYSLQNVLYTVSCFLTSPHHKQVLECHKRKKTEDMRDLRGYTLSECFSWMSWLLWSVEARGHFGLCTPELLEDQV